MRHIFLCVLWQVVLREKFTVFFLDGNGEILTRPNPDSQPPHFWTGRSAVWTLPRSAAIAAAAAARGQVAGDFQKFQ